MEFLTERIVTTSKTRRIKDSSDDWILEIVEQTKEVIMLREIAPWLDMDKLNLLWDAGKLELFTLKEWEAPAGHQTQLYEMPHYTNDASDVGDIWIEKQVAIELLSKIPNPEISPPIPAEPQPTTKAGETDRMPVEAFVKSLKADALKLWAAVRPGQGKEAFSKAVKFLEKNPGLKITIDDVRFDDFRYSEKPKRSVLGSIVQRILATKGYEPLGQGKIESLLR